MMNYTEVDLPSRYCQRHRAFFDPIVPQLPVRLRYSQAFVQEARLSHILTTFSHELGIRLKGENLADEAAFNRFYG